MSSQLPIVCISLALLVLLELSQRTVCVTSLTTNNCAASFNVTNDNITLATNTPIRTLFYSSYRTESSQARIEKIVINGDNGDMNKLMMQLLVPYAALIALFTLLYMIIICCCVFEKSCPPCTSWRRDFIKRPYEKFQLRCVTVFGILFAVIILATSIVALADIPILSKAMEDTKCSLYAGLDVSINGDLPNGWGGFKQLKDQVGNISSLLSSASSNVNTFLSSDSWLLTDMEAYKATNINNYLKNKDAKVVTPNPATTTIALSNNDPLPLVDSRFIFSGLGPNTTTNTMTAEIDQSIRLLETVSLLGYTVSKGAGVLANSATTIAANTLQSQAKLEEYLAQLTRSSGQIDIFSSTYFDQFLGWGFYLLQGLIGFTVAASVFILLGMVATHIYEIIGCKTLVHIGWILYGLTYIGIAALFFVFLGMGSVGQGFCIYFNKMMTNQTEFRRIGDFYSQNVLNKMDLCIYGSGNAMEKFAINREMQTVVDLFGNITAFNNMFEKSNPTYVDTATPTRTITTWIGHVEKYSKGIFYDSDPLLTTDDNPHEILRKLNLATNPSIANPPAKDRWVFDVANCTNTNEVTYQPGSTDTSGLTLNRFQTICVSLNSQFINDGSNSPWNQFEIRYVQENHRELLGIKYFYIVVINNFVSLLLNSSQCRQRYRQIRNANLATYDNIITYADPLINFRNSRTLLFEGLKVDLNNLLTINNLFITKINDFRTRVNKFAGAVPTLNSLVTNKINGLASAANCRIVGDYLRFTNNAFCSNFMTQAVRVGISCLVLVIAMIGGVLTASVFAVRHARMQRQITAVGPTGGDKIVDGNSETFDKRDPTSSSSEQDDQ